MSETVHIDRKLLRLRRARAAAQLDAHDFLLQRVVEDILERLAFIQRRFSKALNLGGHHGLLSQALADWDGIDCLTTTESCPPLLARGEGPRVQCEEDLLPFAPGSFDLVVSGLSLHLVNDVPGALWQIREILRPDGLFLGAVLGGDTLWELRQAFFLAESAAGKPSPPGRVLSFADVRAYGALLQRVGFALPVCDSDRVTVTYDSVWNLLRDLRGMGVTNVRQDTARRPLSRQTLARMRDIYEREFGQADGIPATFEILTLTGWAPHDSQQKPLPPGSAQIPLAQALRQFRETDNDRE